MQRSDLNPADLNPADLDGDTRTAANPTASPAVRLADEYWAYYLETFQLSNIYRRDVTQIEHWPDFSPDGLDARVLRLDAFARRARALRLTNLDEDDLHLATAIGYHAEAERAMAAYEHDILLISAPFNITTFLRVFVPTYILTSAEHGLGYVAKLRSLPACTDAWGRALRRSAAMGRAATARGVSATIAALDELLATDLSDDPLLTQLPPANLSATDVERWKADVRVAVRDQTRPALARFRQMLHDDVLPRGRPDDQPGICHLPNGARDYQALLRAATSTDLDADEIHQIGLRALASLHDEYRSLGPAALGLADPTEIRESLRNDPALRYTDADEIIRDATGALARARAAAPKWFSQLPLSDCQPVVTDAGPTAYYAPSPPDGNGGATFYFNAANPTLWNRCDLEDMTFHESIPGHHLQLGLASELGLHPVLVELDCTAYVEGWGLYAERLADEMGLYSSPLQRLGMLDADSLRCARLVVDTGLHAKCWTREQAVQFLYCQTALDQSTVEAEVDRYIAWPGQATAYLIGRLEIQRLRRLAEERLGSNFSIREFHRVVLLTGGNCPLPELTRRIEGWLVATDAGQESVSDVTTSRHGQHQPGMREN
jgi:uncharacterized protein (DUF885 family)